MLSVNIDNFPLSVFKQVKCLGVTCDSTLSFKAHINSVIHSAYFHIHYINRLRLRAQGFLFILFFFFYGLPSKLLYKIQLVQNSTAQINCRTPITEHITPILQHFHWLPVKCRIDLIPLFTYKALNNRACNNNCLYACIRFIKAVIMIIAV